VKIRPFLKNILWRKARFLVKEDRLLHPREENRDDETHHAEGLVNPKVRPKKAKKIGYFHVFQVVEHIRTVLE
jgi:hypothetical protein